MKFSEEDFNRTFDMKTKGLMAIWNGIVSAIGWIRTKL